MTNNTQLLPCPFCGCETTLLTGREDIRIAGRHGKQCPLLDLDVIVDSREAWNTRAAPAEDVRAVVEEPAGYALDSMLKRIKEDPSSGHMIFGSPNGGYDIPLYRRAQRPVVLPERYDESQYRGTSLLAVRRWNACLDAFEELNK